MQAEDMTLEELEALAASKRGAVKDDSRFREVSVSGVTLAIDVYRLKSWKAFDMIATIEDDEIADTKRLNKMLDLVSFISNKTRDEILDLLGGELADFECVLKFCSDVVKAVDSKN